MLSSNSSSCNQNHNPNYTPFSENDITSFTSTSEDPNFFFGLFPHSPHTQFGDYHFQLFDHVYLNSPPCYSTPAAAVPAASRNPTATRVQRAAAAAGAAAAGKKDRHSKINTARGPRDRRMRLSLDIARRFFDLQDLLGFDKASRTVDWLLRSSGSAIRALARGMPGGEHSSTSGDYGGEGVSSSATAAAAGGKSRRGKRGKRGVQQKRRATVARESRRKARERARERTSQKRRLMRESGAVAMYGAGVQVVEDFSSDEARPTTQWDSFHLHQTHTAPFFPQDEQIEEFEFNGKPWEAYNSFNMSG